MTWTRLGRVIKNQTLALKRVRRSDSGVYLCKAYNKAGEDSKEVIVTVSDYNDESPQITGNWTERVSVIGQSVSQSASQLACLSVCRCVGRSVGRSIGRSVRQSVVIELVMSQTDSQSFIHSLAYCIGSTRSSDFNCQNPSTYYYVGAHI